MNAEEILIKLGIDGSAIGKGLRSAKEQVHDWGKDLAIEFGAIASVATLEEIARQAIESGSQIADTAKRLGISTDAVQAYDFALKKTGGTIDSAAGFFEKLAVSREKAMAGNLEEIDAFKKLGVTIDDLKSKRVEDIAEQISEVFKAGGDPQNLIASLKAVGGKGAGDMVGALTDGLRESREEAIKLGLVIDDNVIRELKLAGDEFMIMAAKAKSAMAPYIADTATGLNMLMALGHATLAGLGAQMSGGSPTAEFREDIKKWADEQASLRASLNKPLTKNTDEATATEKSEVERIEKSIAKIKSESVLKQLTLEQRLKELLKEDAELNREYLKAGLSRVDYAKMRLDIAEKEREISATDLELTKQKNEEEKKKQELLKRQAEIRDEIANKQSERSEHEGDKYKSTIDELAKSGTWTRGSWNGQWQWQDGPDAATARRIQWLQADAHQANTWHNFGRRDADADEIKNLTDGLEASGVMAKDKFIENIDRGIAELNRKLKDSYIKVQPVEGA